MKVAFVTDSGTGKSIHEYAEQGIISLPLQISVDDTTYQDMETLNRNDCIRLMKEGKVLTTSQPSAGIIEECFESLKAQGVELIIAVPICNGLSGTISTMTAIANSLDIKIICIDTYVTAVVQDYLITNIKKWYDEGKSHLEIQILVENIINSTNTLLVPETLEQFIRGGRMTPLAAKLGQLLKIIPVFTRPFAKNTACRPKNTGGNMSVIRRPRRGNIKTAAEKGKLRGLKPHLKSPQNHFPYISRQSAALSAGLTAKRPHCR